MKLEKNTTISHYKILSEIGKGGMGEVYLAEDTKLDRKVAIKFLSDEFSKDTDKLNRFVQEAKAASALNQPNIITIYEIGETDDAKYIALEYIEGETLTKRLKKKLNFNSALDIATQIASALDDAHTAGIVHRDIKPDNVMIRKDGLVKILDFGIAKLTEKSTPEIESEDKTAVQVNTTPGMIIGTANYMSPEQAKGKEVDTRTDVFSFGVVLYEMVTGRLPFEGESPLEIIGSILNKEPKPIDNHAVPAGVERIISKTLRKDRNERYQTIKDVLIDLKDAKQDLEFQDKLDKTIQPNRDEQNTQMFKATTAAEAQNTTASGTNDSITIKKSSFGKVLVGILAVLLASVIGVGYWYFSVTGTDEIDSIAVMPFENNSTSTDSEYLSDGLVESLIYRLSQLQNLRVSPTSSIFRYKGKQTDLVKAGNELQVKAVMTGRIAQRGDDLVISVELVDVRNNKTLWGERYNRKMSDLLATQQEIVTAITQKLKLKLAGEDQKELQKNYTADSEAYQLYLRGRFYNAKRTKANMVTGIKYFEQAIAVDPKFALAYVGISNAYIQMPTYGYIAPKESGPKARAAAKKALEIDPGLAEAHAAVAAVAGGFDRDWKKSGSEFKKAIALDPNVAEIHKLYANNYLLTMGRLNESTVELKRALELEPLSIVYGTLLAANYNYLGQTNKALEQIETVEALEPGHPISVYHRGVIYVTKGRYSDAIALAEKVLEKDPLNQDGLSIAGYAYAKAGQKRKAEDVINRLREMSKSQYVMSSYFAQIYGALGEKDRALAELEKAYEERDTMISLMNVHPYFDDIRDDPRFAAIAKRAGLPDKK
jgi:serine/threonine-protein kinase